jgi:hypothetical protein
MDGILDIGSCVSKHFVNESKMVLHCLFVLSVHCTLSGTTPAMVRKEIWTHLLAYNLTRQVMAQAAREKGISPRQCSFLGAVQAINEFRLLLVTATDEQRADRAQVLRAAVVTHRVAHRPGRCEPRAAKRRPKPLRYLTKPRAEARAELMGQR